jgi:serine O-acetyltransferase
MVERQTSRPGAELGTCDPIWARIRDEAEQAAADEPALASFIFAMVLSHDRLEESVCHRLAHRLNHRDVDADLLRRTFDRVCHENARLAEDFRADLAAVFDRDPACNRMIEPLLYFKGFHALETHRFAHSLWQTGQRDLAFYLQSQSSRIFGVDIHPAANIGRGIMFDHASGIVIGETASIGDNSSLLHAVTLGGSGKEGGNRHPKIGCGVMIGAGASVLGNIKVGNCARIAAGSVVLKDVPPNTTVAGVPARVVGPAGCDEPGRAMDQMLSGD